MKLILRWIGKTRNPHLAALIGDYQSRVGVLVDLTISEVKRVEYQDPVRAVEAEGRQLLRGLGRDDYLIAMDPRGQSMNTETFARLIADRREHSLKRLVFVLGGPDGLSQEVRSCSHRVVSLSSMTFSHEIARLLLLEQIYRTFTLVHRIPYHK
ncbi:MAG: 23S rRNA (pseudouridine(1915)-N(3))-methyltransferase RlmH [Acidobacteriota bacterium]|nr:23S rRNA (pseudouridine(1915)-N(3))-methyltransferase RlmH [Acidobacteriota bacterium]